MNQSISYGRFPDTVKGKFKLMASECEVHIRTPAAKDAESLIEQAYAEGCRIEQHFSRYLEGNLLWQINSANNKPIKLDKEYSQFLEYAISLYQVSEGMFDISCGSLKQLWHFNGAQHEKLNSLKKAELSAALMSVGLDKISWDPPMLTLPSAMALDFGGIGKEYAVDRAAQIIQAQFDGDYLVNYGGDCYCRGTQQTPWTIAVESLKANERGQNAVTIKTGGVATSGTTKRFFTVAGERFGHILNPKTGRPVDKAPLSVTVVHQSCVSAGALATLAMLQGAGAESYLKQQDLIHWVLR